MEINNNEQMQNSSTLDQRGNFVIVIGIVIIVLLVAAGGYFLIQRKNSNLDLPQTSKDQEISEPYKTVQSITKGDPTVLALKDGDLFAIQTSDLSDKRLTSGGGFYTTNQYSYWFSPDQTKLVSKQKETLLLITKDGSKPILQTDLKGYVIDVAWRTDNNALLVWQTLKNQDAPSAGFPTLSEILTYDLETGKTTSIKQIYGWGGEVAMWDKGANVVGYTTGGGEGGAFGDYHILNLGTKDDKAYKTRWNNLSTTPDGSEFIVFDDYDEQGNSSDSSIKIYAILNPDKPLRTFPSPKDFFGCSPQIASNSERPNNCLGIGKTFWFTDGSMIKSFDTQLGTISDITTLPTVQVDVPSRGNLPGNVTLLDVSKNHKTLLIEQEITFNKFEYKLYDLNTKQAKSLGFTKGGTTQPQGTSGQESEFWTHEAIGFLY